MCSRGSWALVSTTSVIRAAAALWGCAGSAGVAIVSGTVLRGVLLLGHTGLKSGRLATRRRVGAVAGAGRATVAVTLCSTRLGAPGAFLCLPKIPCYTEDPLLFQRPASSQWPFLWWVRIWGDVSLGRGRWNLGLFLCSLFSSCGLLSAVLLLTPLARVDGGDRLSCFLMGFILSCSKRVSNPPDLLRVPAYQYLLLCFPLASRPFSFSSVFVQASSCLRCPFLLKLEPAMKHSTWDGSVCNTALQFSYRELWV